MRKRTQASQPTAKSIGMARNFLKLFIQAPGLGRKKRADGKKERRRMGEANPRARAEKTASVPGTGRAKAAARATPMKGAVQGEATATASRPEAKEPVQPCRGLLPARLPSRTLNSKRPSRLRERVSSRANRSQTTGGDWS